LNTATHFCQYRRYHNDDLSILLVSFVSSDPRN
jgi:hypothetical protein